MGNKAAIININKLFLNKLRAIVWQVVNILGFWKIDIAFSCFSIIVLNIFPCIVPIFSMDKLSFSLTSSNKTHRKSLIKNVIRYIWMRVYARYRFLYSIIFPRARTLQLNAVSSLLIYQRTQGKTTVCKIGIIAEISKPWKSLRTFRVHVIFHPLYFPIHFHFLVSLYHDKLEIFLI